MTIGGVVTAYGVGFKCLRTRGRVGNPRRVGRKYIITQARISVGGMYLPLCILFTLKRNA
jgi:hypothetical protein